MYEFHRIRPPGPDRDPFLQQQVLLNGVVHPIIFDVGANKGDITRLYRSRFPNSVIYAFEPFPPSYAQLVESTREDSSVFAQPVALGKETGTIVMQVNTSSATNSLLETEQVAEAYWGHGQVQTISRVEVEVTTLDDFCRKHTVEHIDILKLDTQGTEIQILRGARRMFSEGRVTLVYTEMISAPTYKGQGKLHELLQLLDDHNFSLVSFYNYCHRADGWLLQTDAIFVQRP